MDEIRLVRRVQCWVFLNMEVTIVVFDRFENGQAKRTGEKLMLKVRL